MARTPRVRRALLALVVALASVDSPLRGARRAPNSADRRGAWIENRWDATTGRGAVIHHMASGDSLRTCFHCRYPGYTGGLVIGSQDEPGMAFIPHKPVRGYGVINVFCAWDESLVELDTREEVSWGWSENVGRGDDGAPLRYLRGSVLEADGEHLSLSSENAVGCFNVVRVLTTRVDAPWWIAASQVTNLCDHPVRVSLFAGDDPWIGMYRSSDGDVGWTEDGIVRRERAFGRGAFVGGGFYDLGNELLGQSSAPFSAQADFVAVDPSLPPPDAAFFANGFAHTAAEVDEARALDNATPTALNLAWYNRALRPGERFTWALAMGLAEVSHVGETPRVPKIRDEDWSRWRRWLRADASTGDDVSFAAERVRFTVTEGALTVDGEYTLLNRGDSAVALGIDFPISVAPDRPPPDEVTWDGRPLRPEIAVSGRVVVHRGVALAARSIRRFRITYSQVHRGRRAEYITTTARTWPGGAVGSAFFEVRNRTGASGLRVNHPSECERRDGEEVYRVFAAPFVPDRELVIEW